MTIAASLLCAALLLAACGDDDDGARVVSGPRIVELDGGDSTAVVERDPFRIAFGGAALVAADDPAGGVFYERNGLRHRLLRVVADRADGDGVALDVETSEGEMAHVQLRLDSPRTLAITVDPPRAESNRQPRCAHGVARRRGDRRLRRPRTVGHADRAALRRRAG